MNIKNKNEKYQELNELVRRNALIAVFYTFIFVGNFVIYMSFFYENPIAIFAPMFLIVIAALFCKKFIPIKKHKILNYSPIWITHNIIFFIFLFLSSIFDYGLLYVFVTAVGILALIPLNFLAVGAAESLDN